MPRYIVIHSFKGTRGIFKTELEAYNKTNARKKFIKSHKGDDSPPIISKIEKV